MAAAWCFNCGVGFGAYRDICAICNDKLTYQKDREPSTHQEHKTAEERFLKQVEQIEEGQRPDDKIVNWRFECLLDAGAPPEVADLVASWPNVDLHRACRIFRAGCDPQLAQHILRPVD